jgi:hypothetical protein
MLKNVVCVKSITGRIGTIIFHLIHVGVAAMLPDVLWQMCCGRKSATGNIVRVCSRQSEYKICVSNPHAVGGRARVTTFYGEGNISSRRNTCTFGSVSTGSAHYNYR